MDIDSAHPEAINMIIRNSMRMTSLAQKPMSPGLFQPKPSLLSEMRTRNSNEAMTPFTPIQSMRPVRERAIFSQSIARRPGRNQKGGVNAHSPLSQSYNANPQQPLKAMGEPSVSFSQNVARDRPPLNVQLDPLNPQGASSKHHQMVIEMHQMGEAHKSNLNEISIGAKRTMLKKLTTLQRKFLTHQRNATASFDESKNTTVRRSGRDSIVNKLGPAL